MRRLKTSLRDITILKYSIAFFVYNMSTLLFSLFCHLQLSARAFSDSALHKFLQLAHTIIYSLCWVSLSKLPDICLGWVLSPRIIINRNYYITHIRQKVMSIWSENYSFKHFPISATGETWWKKTSFHIFPCIIRASLECCSVAELLWYICLSCVLKQHLLLFWCYII